MVLTMSVSYSPCLLSVHDAGVGARVGANVGAGVGDIVGDTVGPNVGVGVGLGTHDVAPVRFAVNRPMGHFVQNCFPSTEYLPRVQARQDVAPYLSELRPTRIIMILRL